MPATAPSPVDEILSWSEEKQEDAIARLLKGVFAKRSITALAVAGDDRDSSVLIGCFEKPLWTIVENLNPTPELLVLSRRAADPANCMPWTDDTDFLEDEAE